MTDEKEDEKPAEKLEDKASATDTASLKEKDQA